VAGTNGKGSTAAMIDSILRRAGCRTGLYTSPHLHTVRERVQVSGRAVSEADVLAWLRRAGPALAREPEVTTFEALTALAFGFFAERAVDVAVVEVGLGGTFDATNVVDPIVSLIMPIGLDHTQVLGGTLAQIAGDKAGILHAGVPAVFGPQPQEALEVLQARAGAMGVPVVRVGSDIRVTAARELAEGQWLRIEWPARRQVHEVTLGLLGAHQRSNAAAAVAAALLLSDAGFAIGPSAVAEGLASARWPGRFEVLNRAPTLIVDGAHNPPAAMALAQTMAERLGPRPRLLILGASRDKDVDGVLGQLVPGARWIAVTRAEHPRAMDAARLRQAVLHQAAPGQALTVTVTPDPATALRRALAEAALDEARVATGSLFVVAEVREAWAELGGMPMPPRDPPPRPAGGSEGPS
jgi:dihydrofolate synthase/folylpolyglutamate synthase